MVNFNSAASKSKRRLLRRICSIENNISDHLPEVIKKSGKVCTSFTVFLLVFQLRNNWTAYKGRNGFIPLISVGLQLAFEIALSTVHPKSNFIEPDFHNDLQRIVGKWKNTKIRDDGHYGIGEKDGKAISSIVGTFNDHKNNRHRRVEEAFIFCLNGGIPKEMSPNEWAHEKANKLTTITEELSRHVHMVEIDFDSFLKKYEEAIILLNILISGIVEEPIEQLQQEPIVYSAKDK